MTRARPIRADTGSGTPTFSGTVLLDGKPTRDARGADVGADGVARFDRSGMIRLVVGAACRRHVLTLVTSDPACERSPSLSDLRAHSISRPLVVSITHVTSTAILEKLVSDRGTLEHLSQSRDSDRRETVSY